MELSWNAEDYVDPLSVSHDEVRKHWEEKFAAEEQANLFPRQSVETKPARRQNSGIYNADDVDTNPMAHLSVIKQRWESKMTSPPEDAARKRFSSGETDDSECDSSLNNNSIYSNSVRTADDSAQSYESAIELDIRLAQERERDVRREHERLKNVAKKRDKDRQVATQQTRVEIAVTRCPPFDDRTATIMSPVAVAGNSSQPHLPGGPSNGIRREVTLTKQKSRNTSSDDTLRTNTERSRTPSGSIIEREIRLQQDREAEIASLRASIYHPGNESQPETNSPLPRDDVVSKTIASDVPAPLAKVPVPDTSASVEAGMTTKSTEPLAIKVTTYRTSGDVIADELREYEAREAELRERWVTMGLDVPKTAQASNLGADLSTSPRSPTTEPMGIHLQKPRGNQHNGTPSEDGSDSEASFHSGDSAAARFHKLLKVHPITDDIDEADSAKYVPRTDTAVERDMRLARQREDELRCQRGLTPVLSPITNKDSEPAVTMRRSHASQPGTRPGSSGAPGVGARLKRFSSGRLQSEIERDRQRELQLRDEGKITTMSEDRIAKPAVYTEVTPR